MYRQHVPSRGCQPKTTIGRYLCGFIGFVLVLTPAITQQLEPSDRSVGNSVTAVAAPNPLPESISGTVLKPRSERSAELIPHEALADNVSSTQPKDQPASVEDPLDYGRQTKRILYIVPNFRAVSAGAHLPPQTAKDKLLEATQDTFDYSNWVFVGMLAGIDQAENSTPAFRQGGVGYGRYYWHVFVDQANENYLVEGIMPIVFRQDTRYYTLGRGGFLRRTFYACSRGVVTRSDFGAPEPNYSEIIGAGAAAGISNLYYPGAERSWTKTGQRWVTNVGLDIMTSAFKEFWPDINRKIFHSQ